MLPESLCTLLWKSSYVVECCTFVSTKWYTNVTADTLTENFFIGPEWYTTTLKVTMKRWVQSFIFTIHMKYRMYWMLQVKGLNGKYEIGAILLKTKSLQYNMTMQIYRNKCDFIYFCHILNSNNKKLDFSSSKSIHEFGSPENLIFYGTTV